MISWIFLNLFIHDYFIFSYRIIFSYIYDGRNQEERADFLTGRTISPKSLRIKEYLQNYPPTCWAKFRQTLLGFDWALSCCCLYTNIPCAIAGPKHTRRPNTDQVKQYRSSHSQGWEISGDFLNLWLRYSKHPWPILARFYIKHRAESALLTRTTTTRK